MTQTAPAVAHRMTSMLATTMISSQNTKDARCVRRKIKKKNMDVVINTDMESVYFLKLSITDLKLILIQLSQILSHKFYFSGS